MKNHLLFFITTFISGTFGLNNNNQLPAPFVIVPQPKEIVFIRESGIEYGTLSRLKKDGRFNRPVMGEILNLLPEISDAGKNVGKEGILTLKLVENNITVPESEEGYILTISNGNAEIISKGEPGLFYGCQTLEQLLEDARDFNTPIPACKITDYPAIDYRAVHFDVKHHLDHVNYYYKSIDRLARYKINAVIFEFEDKLRYQRQPLVGAPQAISINEMIAITQYARKRNIEISPLVQGLGHATFILKHQEYAHLRELPDNRWAFCPLHEGMYQVLFDLYRDAMEATPGSRYLHVGGDEIGNIGLCPRCKPFADKKGLLALNLYWLERVCDFAVENGRTPIFWDDMPLKYAGVMESASTRSIMGEKEAKAAWDTGRVILNNIIEKYPKECIYMRWNYSMARQPGNIMTLDWYNEKGLETMVSTAAHSGGAVLFPFDDRYKGMLLRGIPAIKSFVELAAEKGISGNLTTAWDDRSPHMETYWRGFIAAAEYCWSPYKKTLEEFDLAYLQREFGTTIPDYSELYRKLRDASVFWEKAFNRNGGRMDMENALLNLPGLAHWIPPGEQDKPLKSDFTDVLIELPDLQNPGGWSEKYSQRLNEAEVMLKEYQVTSKVLNDFYNKSRSNRHHWEVFAALNDFQVTAPQLLLALKQCDTNDMNKIKEGIVQVNSALDGFNHAWQNLQTVYSKTRFISHPDNYVPDRYFHFASQREDLTWMIQAEELYHKMVTMWLKESTQN